DYLAVARRFHTVIIVGIPVMTRAMRNEAARFVTLIDALYEHRVKLLASADSEPAGLYPEGDGAFEFQRTVSRLEEMRSADYLAEGHGAA
ncbi:MAG TPA: AFG1/ZapE family ATPase, partial [Sphingomicrobium sp.]|nr:AFG1/ZapE family ATPase [Sphingomicrobium sp.]